MLKNVLKLTVDHGYGRLSRRRTRPSGRRHPDRHRVLPERVQVVQRYRGDASIQYQGLCQLPVVVGTALHLVRVEVGERRRPGAGEGGGRHREAVDGP